MFEVIGILAVWLIGAVASFIGPIISSGIWARTGDGLSDLAIGLFAGRVLCAIYLILTVAYLAAT